MPPFRTIVSPEPSDHKISLGSSILTIGSCFADAIGNRLLEHKFNAIVNPFGTVYNPLSLHALLLQALENRQPSATSYVERDGIWMNYGFHSSFSSMEKKTLEEALAHAVQGVRTTLQKAEWLLITYGTAWAYQRRDNGETVSNCHKMPGNLFTKYLISPEEMMESFRAFQALLFSINPNIRILLTISPVRHLRDTLPLNSVGKAALHLFCHQASALERTRYFPAFEMAIDDLRDYRFYKGDMLHLTEQGEDYIWEKFIDTYLSPSTRQFIGQWDEIREALRHRPFHPTSAPHQQFLKNLLAKIQSIQEQNPSLNVDEEMKQVRSQMTS